MYGIILATAILTATLVAEKLILTSKKSLYWEGLIWALLGGIIGARLYHVLSFSIYYAQFPLEIIHIQNGGLAFLGAFIGGIITGFSYLKLKKEPIMYWLNIAAIVLPLAQAIGRLGNLVNNELYGLPSKLPWAIYIPMEKRIEQYKQFETYHPLFLYELVLNLLLFAIVMRFKKHAFYIYITGYGIIRFALEFLRLQQDTWQIGMFNVAQVICIMMVVTGSMGLCRTYKK